MMREKRRMPKSLARKAKYLVIVGWDKCHTKLLVLVGQSTAEVEPRIGRDRRKVICRIRCSFDRNNSVPGDTVV